MNHSVRSYILGFILSLALTLVAFALVTKQLLDGPNLMFVIVVLALIQFWVQLIFFLHLDQERGPRWNLVMFLSTMGIVLVLVIGTLVIMRNLNYHHMSGSDADAYILEDEGIHK
jgi:cytochrome o ubiquinol oxidase operon protein cyoD